MAPAQKLINALLAPQVAGKPSKLADSMKTLAPPGQQFMHIRLVPNIPDQQIIGRIEDVVQSHRQFYNAEVRSQVSAFYRNLFDDLPPDFFGQLPQLRGLQCAQ